MPLEMRGTGTSSGITISARFHLYTAPLPGAIGTLAVSGMPPLTCRADTGGGGGGRVTVAAEVGGGGRAESGGEGGGARQKQARSYQSVTAASRAHTRCQREREREREREQI